MKIQTKAIQAAAAKKMNSASDNCYKTKKT